MKELMKRIAITFGLLLFTVIILNCEKISNAKTPVSTENTSEIAQQSQSQESTMSVTANNVSEDMEKSIKSFVDNVEEAQKKYLENQKQINTCITIDFPQTEQNSRNTLYIQGWQLSNEENRKVEVWINENNVTDKMAFSLRQDAINAMRGQGFGDESTNANSGFRGNIDISNYATGNYTLKVKVILNSTNKVLAESSRIISINKATFEIGTYGSSGLKVAGNPKGTDLKYYRYGDGPNVFFATFVLHGFEDNFGRDGTEVSVIAENFINELRSKEDHELTNKWTIYIFPEINPDGRNYGWTNNGPGRTTLYSAAPRNKGVDINRCWSTSFVPMYTDRNYTGSTSFNSYEARYLRDFLLNKKSTTGQTVLVDLHGWTTQVIGDNGICSYYKQKFPSTQYTPSYGKGYLINWARSSLGANGRTARSALIELPEYGTNGKKILSHQDVLDSGYSRKYIDATINMLKGI